MRTTPAVNGGICPTGKRALPPQLRRFGAGRSCPTYSPDGKREGAPTLRCPVVIVTAIVFRSRTRQVANLLW